MYFIGDVHGHFLDYNELVKKLPCSIQLGDMGIGFKPYESFPVYSQHRWIRGNHDNPIACKGYSNYLGDFGYLEEEEIFFVSGGFSIDRMYRTEGINWWRDEELDVKAQAEVVKLYTKIKPRIVISHECPRDAIQYVGSKYIGIAPSSTAALLNHLWGIHSPQRWIFGHHHTTMDFEIDNVKFQAVNILDAVEIE